MQYTSDCFAWSALNKSCACLTETLCKTRGRCSFYATPSQCAAAAAKANARLDAIGWHDARKGGKESK